jgi:stearoyl-CoA desaturase (delta-9 desaturase)
MSQMDAKAADPKLDYNWAAIIYYGGGTLVMFYGLLALFMGRELISGEPILWQTYMYMFVFYNVEILSVTAGVHRMWSHRSYRAAWPLRMFYMLGLTMGNVGITSWVKVHRIHHLHSDTDLDPHNARHGLFFSHMGWQMLKIPAPVRKAIMEVDVSDLDADFVVRIQRVLQSYKMGNFWAYVLPGFLAMWGWNQSLLTGMLIAGFTRKFMCLHGAFFINSIAHYYGDRPYSSSHLGVDFWLASVITLGEGWHNYHHTFAFDYAAAELHWTQQWNPTYFFIDVMSVVGLAWDKKRGTKMWDARKQLWEKNTGKKVVESIAGPPLFRVRKISLGPEPYGSPCLLGSESPEKLVKGQ